MFEDFLLQGWLCRIKSWKVQHKLNNVCFNLIHCRVDVSDGSIVKRISTIGSEVSDFLIVSNSGRTNREHNCTFDKSTAASLSTFHDIIALNAGLFLA